MCQAKNFQMNCLGINIKIVHVLLAKTYLPWQLDDNYQLELSARGRGGVNYN